MVDLRQLRQFLVLAEELHFSRAAERLGMTQPPLSQSIMALEKSLGVKLFARNRRKVALTTTGALWLPYVRRLLDDAENLPGLAMRLGGGEMGTLRLNFLTTALYGGLPDLMRRYKEINPGIEIVMREAPCDLQLQNLLDDKIDVGVLMPPPRGVFPSSLAYHPVLRETLIAAVPEAWLDGGLVARDEDGVDLRRLSEQPLLLFPRRAAPAFHDAIARCYARIRRRPVLGQQAMQMHSLLGLVSAGFGFTLVPASMAQLARSGVVYRPLADDPPIIETGVAWHKLNTAPSLERLVELVAQNPIHR